MRQQQAPTVIASTAQEGAREALEREQLVLNVAHELKSPLTGLRLQVERAQRQLQRDPELAKSEHYPRFVSQMDHGLARLQRLIEDLLEVTRFHTHGLPLNLSPASMDGVVQTALADLEPQLAQYQFTLKSNFNGDSEGLWDVSRLQQVVTNLVNNAMRYGASPLEIDVRGSAEQVEVAVRDHGAGIPQAERGCIFERFERGQGTEGTPGLGLGLAICQNILRAHGGDLRVDDPAQGPGALFVFQVPRAPSSANGPQEIDPAAH